MNTIIIFKMSIIIQTFSINNSPILREHMLIKFKLLSKNLDDKIENKSNRDKNYPKQSSQNIF